MSSLVELPVDLGSAFCLQTSAQAETLKLPSNPFNPLTGKSLVLMDKGCLELGGKRAPLPDIWFLSAPYRQETHEPSVALRSKCWKAGFSIRLCCPVWLPDLKHLFWHLGKNLSDTLNRHQASKSMTMWSSSSTTWKYQKMRHACE